MIKKIQIQNYRSCIDTTFNLQSDLSVLIGPNGSGKTNILNALLLLKKLVEEGPPRYYEEDKSTGKCQLKVWFDISGKTVCLTANIDTYTDESNSDIVVSSIQQWYVKPFTGSAKRLHTPLGFIRQINIDSKKNIHRQLLNRRILRGHYSFSKFFKEELPDSAQQALVAIAKYLSEMKYYSASQFTNPSNCPISFEIEKEGGVSRGLRLQTHTKFLFDLYTEYKSSDKSRYQQFFDIVGPNGIGLVNDIDFKEIPTSSIDYSVKSGGKVREKKREKILVIPQFVIGKHELSPNQLSEGTFKTITLLFYLITEAGSILLIEEPEVCVHHGLLSSIIELIKTYSREKQIVVSTHSDFVLDKVSPENVYKVSRTSENGSKVYHIPKSMSRLELTALRDYLAIEGNLGEYWKHGTLE